MRKYIHRLLLVGVIALTTGCTDKDPVYTNIEGLWHCQEIDEYSRATVFSVDIQSVHNYPGTYIISNFHNLGDDIYIHVNLRDSSMQISSQAAAGMIVSGGGIVSSDFRSIYAEYAIDDIGITYNVSASFNR